MSKFQIINLINAPELLQFTLLKQFISTLSKNQVKDYILYNYGHLLKTKDEIYKTFNKFTQNEFKKGAVRKYIKQSKLTLMPDPMTKSKTGVKKATTNHYKPQKNLMIY